jgi:hypothetical protein
MLLIKTEFMNQVAKDWKVAPFTDVVVTSGSFCPPTHPNAVFDRTWHGMKNGCNCLNIYSSNINTDNEMVPDYMCDRN